MRIKKILILYFLSLFFLVSANLMCNVVFVSNYLVYLRLIAYIGFLIIGILNLNKSKIIKKSYFVLITILFMLSLITYFRTDNTILIDLFFVALASYKKSFNDILVCDLLVKIIVTLIIITSHFFGLAESIFVVSRDELYVRAAFGFYHPNTFGMYIMMIYFDVILLFRFKKLFIHYILGGCAIALLYFTSNSRTSYIAIIFYLVLLTVAILFKKICKKENSKKGIVSKITLLIFKYYFPILTLLSIICTQMYKNGNSLILLLDKVLSNRLYLQALNLEQNQIRMFGYNIDVIRTLDNGFLKLILNYGVVSFLFFSYIFAMTVKNAYKNKDVILCLVVIAILFFTISESLLLYVYNNIILIYVFCYYEQLKGDERWNR